jgi:GNAT superfamily N-acetyltransferase
MALRTDAENWLRQIGSDQWSDPEIGSRAISKWHQHIEDGRTWVLLNEADSVLGTVSRGSADRDFWNETDEPHTAFYLYKLIISRDAAGDGIGSLVLDWACRVAALEGRRWLRIDCWRTARGLQLYYERLGFTHVRTETPPHRKSGWLAQRPSGAIFNPERALIIDSGDFASIPATRDARG